MYTIYAENDRFIQGLTVSNLATMNTWEEWAVCSHSCGEDGTRSRARSCHNYITNEDMTGEDCIGYTDQLSQTENCRRVACRKYLKSFLTVLTHIFSNTIRMECRYPMYRGMSRTKRLHQDGSKLLEWR